MVGTEEAEAEGEGKVEAVLEEEYWGACVVVVEEAQAHLLAREGAVLVAVARVVVETERVVRVAVETVAAAAETAAMGKAMRVAEEALDQAAGILE